jgi:hypothetical protein
MSFEAGDYLIFQIESGYGLLRILAVETSSEGEKTWHISTFDDLFLDVEFAEIALENPTSLNISVPHIALTNRAFESTQVSKITNEPLQPEDLEALNAWQENPSREVLDRSVRLMLGLR